MNVKLRLLSAGVLFFAGQHITAQTAKKDTSSVKDIEGVVVTALGIKRAEKSLGYAASKVNSEELTQVANQNIVNSLSGKVAGLQVIASGGAPGQASRLVIRGGNKSLTNSNEPLYVIDGIPISNANDGNSNTVSGMASPNRVADINPEDIENVTVLKGSAGAVLYGNRGSNGVIVITTKSGKVRGNKPVITFTTRIGTDNALKLPEYQTVYAQGNNGVYAEGTSLSFGPKINGQMVTSTAAGAALGLGPQSVPLRVYDPRSVFFQTGITKENNISLAQNINNNSNVFFSAGHNSQTSIVPNQEYEKFNFRFNGSFKLTDRFSAGVNASYNRSWGNVPFAGQDGNNPIFSIFHVPVSWDLSGYGYERPDNGKQINFRGGSFDNPLWSVYKNSAKTTSNRFIMGVNLGYDLTDWLKLSYRVGNDYFTDNRVLFRDINTGGNPNGRLIFDDITREELTSTFMANINKNITDDLNLTVNLGQDYNVRKYRNSTITGTALVLPGVINTNNIKTFDPGFYYNSKRTLFGAFTDLTLGFKNYLYLNLVGRQEWSSTLPENNRSYFYPGGSLSFIFTDAFGISKNIMNYGKIRFGISRTARDASPYSIYNTYNKGIFADGFTAGITFPFMDLPGYTVANTLNNPNLKPEFTTEYEVGTDLRFLKDRVGLEFTYFKNLNTNGIIPLDISPASGASATIINSGKTSSNGIELIFRATPVKTTNFTWDVSFNFSRIRSLVEEIYPGVDKIYLGGFSGNPAIFAVKGERYGSIIGTKYARNDQGQILTDSNGYPMWKDGENLGYVEPDWTGGVSTSFKYKGVYLNALLDMRFGGYLYNGTEQLLDTYGVSKKTLNREEDYIFPGVNSTTGAQNNVSLKRNSTWYGNAYPNEEYVYKNNWVKLREISIGYSFKLPGIDYIRNVDIGLYGRNLFLWTKIPHVDPESSSFGTGNAQGVTRMAFPTTRSFGFSLKVQF
ncbi:MULTISPECIES: SusC/RagA family TonB-linked outer membrane protein [Elizabethkingia]|uniref:SusC/RagA family TonB-linked outer membrane protein n=1 Tax=Elizabethkingia meningoseptica TaxID=238 RepID=A0A1T3FK19_ELIME|nr:MULTISPECIES: SusC/RagA family TonB-linked outer membrane protein [Elizabethkingia]AQX13712.1 SusC/RagA family TonB-linked outer membrane protein [Elizabethkingia meningoseptica]MBG0515509.1 SusC/RagA family TonB-linked outer membrane protein [Elizabethkingia meningoseptica]MDE5434124.1 SusC/RagA family TonB-linked outer membrane protein [Elizabethkingia meningoseptica]MDE5448759.1 SusC/RagA family TonB-linked outer membrane protein [Elizabethkingia meningoseptica]MDE5470402.1 SusC/RagA fam